MNAEPRTATVDVLVTRPLEIDEPDWCDGRHNERAQYKVDVAHTGPEHAIAPGGRELLRAMLTQNPFATTDRTIGLYVEVADISGTLTPAEVDQFADDLIEAATRLRELGVELAAILSGGGQ